MHFSVRTAALCGVEAYPIDAEVDTTPATHHRRLHQRWPAAAALDELMPPRVERRLRIPVDETTSS